jgi:hypothetical protein
MIGFGDANFRAVGLLKGLQGSTFEVNKILQLCEEGMGGADSTHPCQLPWASFCSDWALSCFARLEMPIA